MRRHRSPGAPATEFSRLVAALVRTCLAKDLEDVLEGAAERQPARLAPRGRDAI